MRYLLPFLLLPSVALAQDRPLTSSQRLANEWILYQGAQAHLAEVIKALADENEALRKENETLKNAAVP